MRKRNFRLAVCAAAVGLLALSPLAMAGNMNAFSLTSASIPKSGVMPDKQYWNNFGCSGGNLSPSLEWSNAPKDTKSFAITFYDNDAPTGSGFWHWVAYNIPASVTSIAEGAASAGVLPAGAVEGHTDLGKPGWFGSCPPVGRKHRYTYTVYALKVDKLDVPADASPAFVGFTLWRNMIGKAALTTTAGPRKP